MFFRKKKEKEIIMHAGKTLADNIRIILITDKDVRKYCYLLYNNYTKEEANKKIQEDLKIEVEPDGKGGFIIKFDYKGEKYVSEAYPLVMGNYDFLKNIVILHICALLDIKYKFGDLIFNRMEFYFTKKYIIERREEIKNDTFELISIIMPLISIEKDYFKQLVDNQELELKISILESILCKIKRMTEGIIFIKKREIDLLQYFFDILVKHMTESITIGKTNYKVINKKEFDELLVMKKIDEKVR